MTENTVREAFDESEQIIVGIEPCDVLTGGRDKNRFLLYQLKRSMACAEQIDIIVSFLMESGVRLLLADLKQALDRGVKIRIHTGNYLGITQPGALYLIKTSWGIRWSCGFTTKKGGPFIPRHTFFIAVTWGKFILARPICPAAP